MTRLELAAIAPIPQLTFYCNVKDIAARLKMRPMPNNPEEASKWHKDVLARLAFDWADTMIARDKKTCTLEK